VNGYLLQNIMTCSLFTHWPLPEAVHTSLGTATEEQHFYKTGTACFQRLITPEQDFCYTIKSDTLYYT